MSLSIGEAVARSGVAEATLRMWERRYGFPRPERTPSGHRRYSEHDVELVRRVAAGRQAGLSPRAAIERARAADDDRTFSLFARLRQRRPELEPRLLRKQLMLALSHAIEDESLTRGERHSLFGCFQRAGFYRREQKRWLELVHGGASAAVFADFRRSRSEMGRPAEIRIDHDHPLAREWALVCDGDGYGVCLVGRERATSNADSPSARRMFEAIWSVEPAVVRDAARICAEVASQTLPEMRPVAERLQPEPALPTAEQLRLAASITNRTFSSL